MRILVDIVHPVDVNFYKKAIEILRKDGHEVIITVMKRGKLPQIAKYELGKVNIVGGHSKGRFVKKAMMNIRRLAKLRSFIRKVRPDVVTSFSYYPAAASFGMNIPSFVFHDDAEYKKQFFLCKTFATRLIIPDFIKTIAKNIRKYHSYKEWSYLNPKYFKPDEGALKEYKLKNNRYIFVRDIAKVSLNYKDKKEIRLENCLKELKSRGYDIVVYLENKSRADLFRDYIHLKEPLKDIFSLLYYSRAVISSGDTTPREAALMGVPAYYTGGRDMAVNRELIRRGLFFKIKDEDDLLEHTRNIKSTRKIMESYGKEIDDTTEVIVRAIENG